MTAALPFSPLFRLGGHKYSDGKDPDDEERTAFTANLTDISIMSRLRKLGSVTNYSSASEWKVCFYVIFAPTNIWMYSDAQI